MASNEKLLQEFGALQAHSINMEKNIKELKTEIKEDFKWVNDEVKKLETLILQLHGTFATKEELKEVEEKMKNMRIESIWSKNYVKDKIIAFLVFVSITLLSIIGYFSKELISVLWVITH